MIRNHILKNQNSGHPDFTILRSGTLGSQDPEIFNVENRPF